MLVHLLSLISKYKSLVVAMIVGLDVRDALKQVRASVVPVTLYSSKRQESSQF